MREIICVLRYACPSFETWCQVWFPVLSAKFTMSEGLAALCQTSLVRYFAEPFSWARSLEARCTLMLFCRVISKYCTNRCPYCSLCSLAIVATFSYFSLPLHSNRVCLESLVCSHVSKRLTLPLCIFLLFSPLPFTWTSFIWEPPQALDFFIRHLLWERDQAASKVATPPQENDRLSSATDPMKSKIWATKSHTKTSAWILVR